MLKYIVKRLLLSIFIMVGVSMIIYFMIRLMPMDFVTQQFNSLASSGNLSEAKLQELKEIYGLADNSFFGIFKGYFSWLWAFLQGDMGTSFKYSEPVEKIKGLRPSAIAV